MSGPLPHDEPHNFGQTLIVLGGVAGANTSSLANELASELNTSVAGFADHLRGIAKSSNRSEDYPTLQNIGLNVIAQQGWAAFCAWVWKPTAADKETAIIDGLRHVDAVRQLRQIARPRDLFIVYVDVSAEEQQYSIKNSLLKQNLPDYAVDAVLEHPVEAESKIIRHLADRTVRDSREYAAAIADVQELIANRRAHEPELLQKRSELSNALFDELQSQIDRYESLREIVRLLEAIAGAEPIGIWLRTPRVDLGQQSPIEILLRGDPGQAITAALHTIQGP